MPQPKRKSENYQNLGGINVKASEYITGPQQFLNLVNFDFQLPGSLSQRWGTTQYMSQASSVNINSLYEYENSSGFSKVIFTGGSYAYYITGTVFDILRSSFAVGYSGVTITAANGPTTVHSLYLGVTGLNLFDGEYSFVSYDNHLFSANGRNFWKSNGLSTYLWGLPMPPPPSLGDGVSPVTGQGSSAPNGFSGYYYYRFGYINNRGTWGPMSSGNTGYVLSNRDGQSSVILDLKILQNQYQGFGISSLVIYRTQALASLWPSSGGGGVTNQISDSFFKAVRVLPVGSTRYFVDTDPNQGLTSAPNVISYDPIIYRYYNFSQSGFAGSYSIFFSIGETFVPRYLDVYNNQMMMAGYSFLPSTFFFSNIGDPESINPLNSIPVRTNDGDRITGIKSFNGAFMIFKQKSFHILTGEDPANFALRELSDQYGCVSHRAIAQYNDFLLFLDRKGIVKFNGANFEIISTPLDPLFQRMNLTAALDKATMVHDKVRNQVLIGMPIDGSTVNNITIVYDYLLDAWTTYDGYDPQQYVTIKGRNSEYQSFFSNYSNMIHNFWPSLTSDNGVGFTVQAKSRFVKLFGESIEEQFRRLYLNVDPITSATIGLTINFYQDYGTSNVLTRTMYADPFQSRIDFGIPAKSLSFEVSKNDADTILRLHGFTIESRLQRWT